MLTHTNLQIGRKNYNLPAPFKSNTSSCRETAAWHEAGHAAKLIHAGLPLREAVISTDGSIGYVTCWLPRKAHQRDFVTAVMCGSRAEQLLTGKFNEEGAIGDLQIATRVANGNMDVLEGSRVAAGKFVAEHQKEIEVLAEKLLFHGKLAAREIRESFRPNTSKEAVALGDPIFLPLSIIPELLSREELLTSRRLPARLSAEHALFLLGFQQHHAAILINSRLLKPLGKPAANGVKYFATCEIEKLRGDRDWLDKATAAVQKNWLCRRERLTLDQAKDKRPRPSSEAVEDEMN